jgi:hypothetical protein
MRNLIAILLLTFSAMAQAEPIETWECKQYGSGGDSILVTATVEEGRKEGRISVAGVTHVAEFAVTGFDRRWNFGPKKRETFASHYAFIIMPNGEANYYDFTLEDTAKPSNRMWCSQKPAEKAPKAPK